MKVVQINATCGRGSTGKICVELGKLLTTNNIENYILYSDGESSRPGDVKGSGRKYIKLQALRSRIAGNYGFNSELPTHRMIRELERIEPDIVHLHNIHGHDCDLEGLFRYLRKSGVKVLWTFHDCWAFTGYCTHFDYVNCAKWKTGCGGCPQRGTYSWFFDRSAELYEKKKSLLSGVDLTVVTPSRWLSDLVKQSFLGSCPVITINNGIDLEIFRPTESEFRVKYGISESDYIVLGVAYDWGVRKGLDIFSELSKRLDSRYRIVLVGTDSKVDRKLPENIISVHRTQDQRGLAEIYSAADVFVNPTREDNFPTVNIEALACGTPVVTFETGGSPESLDETCGSVVERGNVEMLEREIVRICEERPYSAESCVKRASEYSKDAKFREYIELYRSMK